MSAVAIKPKEPGIFLRYWPLWGFGAAIALFAITVLGRDPLRSYLAGNILSSATAKAKASGVPATAADVWPPLSNDSPKLTNALVATYQARAKLSRDERHAIDFYGTAKYKSGAEEAIRKLTPTLDSIAALPATPSYFQHDPEKGISVELPELGWSSWVVRAFCVRSNLSARRGDHKSALEDLRLARKLEQSLGFTCTVTMTVQAQCEQRIASTLNDNLTLNPSTEDLLAYRQFCEQAPTFDFFSALRADAYLQIASAKSLDYSSFVAGSSQYGPYAVADDNSNEPDIEHGAIPNDLKARDAMAQQLTSWAKLFNELRPVVNDRAKAHPILVAFDGTHSDEVSLSSSFMSQDVLQYTQAYDQPIAVTAKWL